MKKAFLIIIVITSILLVLQTSCDKEKSNSKGNIEGIIIDAITTQPIKGANITISPSNSSATTGSDGKYQFSNIEEGDYTISVSKNGYSNNTKQVTVLRGQVRHGDIALTPLIPILGVNINSLDFGTNITLLPIEITNTGSNELQWQISENIAWLTINPIAGSTTTETDAIEIVIDRNQMASGQYSQVFSITSNGGNKTITVNIEVPVNTVPSVTCNQPTNLSQTSADINGSITSIGNSTIIERGHCWSTSPNPTIANQKTSLGGTTSTGQFTSNLTALQADQVYSVRAYATNANGTGYSNEITFTTSSASSVVVTNGLIAYYTFDNQNANDWNGIYNGILDGCISSSDIPNSNGYSMLFDNTTDRIRITGGILNGLTNMSVSFWIKTTSSSSGIIGYVPIGASTKMFRLITDNYAFLANYSHSDYANFTASNSAFDGSWHHIVITKQNQVKSKLYIDGQLFDDYSYGGHFPMANYTMQIGATIGTSFYDKDSFIGKLDNLRFYNRLLSQTEIQQIFNLQQ